MQAPSSRRLLRKGEVRARCGGITDATLHRWGKLYGDFPEPVILNPGAKNPHVAWYEDEIDEWVESRPRGSGRALAPEVYERHSERHRAAAAARQRVVPIGRVTLLPVEERRRRADAAQRVRDADARS